MRDFLPNTRRNFPGANSYALSSLPPTKDWASFSNIEYSAPHKVRFIKKIGRCAFIFLHAKKAGFPILPVYCGGAVLGAKMQSYESRVPDKKLLVIGAEGVVFDFTVRGILPRFSPVFLKMPALPEV